MAAQAPPPAKPAAKDRSSRWGDAGGFLVEGLFELLFASELGLIVFGGVALTVGLPLLVVFGGAAWAAHVRRKQQPGVERIGLGALLTPAVLFVIFLVLVLFGVLGLAAFQTGHPVVMGCSYAAALATLGFVGFMAAQRRHDRLPHGPGPRPSEKLKNR